MAPPPPHSDPAELTRTARAPRRLRLAAFAGASAIAAGTAGAYTYSAVWIPFWAGSRYVWLTTYFFRSQDVFWLAAMALLLAGFAVARLPATPSRAAAAILRHPRMAVAIIAAFVLAAGVVGSGSVFHDFHLTADESLASFDATIYRSGMAVAPVSPQWQPYAHALEPKFMAPIAHGAGFVSGYLPINAAFRAIVGLVADPAWTSPLLAALATLAVFGVARRLWPNRPDAALVSALLLATSPQVLVTSMTSYAMTGHLALNLLWLWLFLRDDRIGHTGAIGVGFLATGLHQLIFHPLFAAPFVLKLWSARRGRVALVYIGSYALICLFWIAYPWLAVDWQGLVRQGASSVGFEYFIVRAVRLLVSFNWAGAGLMLKNLLRFVAWQNPILLPLTFVAYRSIRSNEGIAPELAAGILFTVTAMFLLLPDQGFGWGYRYLHGLIGNFALLAGYGWVTLSVRISREEMAAAGRMFAIAGGAALFILLPVRARQAHDFVMPYARAYQAIEHAPTDLVIVDKTGLLLAEDLIRNDPFLRNRPKMMDLTFLDQADLAALCARYTVSVFDRSQGRAFSIPANDQLYKFDDAVRHRLRAVMARLSCGHELPISGGQAEQPGQVHAR